MLLLTVRFQAEQFRNLGLKPAAECEGVNGRGQAQVWWPPPTLKAAGIFADECLTFPAGFTNRLLFLSTSSGFVET